MGTKQVRVIYGDGAFLTKCDHVQENIAKVFAVIGPFDGHMDKMELQRAIEMVCRGYNIKTR